MVDLSISDSRSQRFSMETLNLPAILQDTGAGAPEFANFGAPSFDLSTDLGITAIIVGGLSIIAVTGYLWAQPYLRGVEFAIDRGIGAVKASDKLFADASKTFSKLGKGLGLKKFKLF